MVHSVAESSSESELLARQTRLLERYERIIELSRHLSTVLELPRLEQIIVEAAREMTGSEASSILLVDPRSGDLYFESASGPTSEEIQRYAVPMESSIAGWVVQHGEPVVLDDAQKDVRHFQKSDIETAFTTNSLIAVPMSVKGKTIGVLEALNKANAQSFDEEDVFLLMTLANQAAVAIENARLFLQSDLIAEMVHELRTPLTAILSYSDLLLNSSVDENQRIQFLETVRSEAERLTNMTNDFLDWARLSSGRARLVRSPVNLCQVVANAVTVVRPHARDKGVNVSMYVAENLPAVRGDAERLHQVVLNLLSNAIKYNRANGRVWVTVDFEADDRRFLRVAVQDTGQGIAEENVAHLFERFYRVADAEGFARGTGLGLSIAQQIVQAHEGKMDVASELGVGSTFSFTVPVLQTEE